MAITDTGGFDLSLELTEELLNAAFTAPRQGGRGRRHRTVRSTTLSCACGSIWTR